MKHVSIITMILLIVIFSSAALGQGPDTAYFWAGGHFNDEDQWYDTIYATPNRWIDIPVYFAGGPDVLVEGISYPLGARYDIIDQFDSAGCSFDFWPFNEPEYPWQYLKFFNYNSDYDEGQSYINPPGYHSFTFIGLRIVYYPQLRGPLLQSAVPIKILTFKVHISESLETIGQVYADALIGGMDPVQGVASAWDSTGTHSYGMSLFYACLKIAEVMPGSVEGVVTDAGANLLEDVLVEVYEGETLINSDLTNGDGAYEVAGIPPGTYSIVFSLAGYYDATSFNVSVVEDLTTTVDMIMHRPASYGGTVTDETLAPLSDVHVRAIASTLIIGVINPMESDYRLVDEITEETWTDENGEYELSLNPGDYIIYYALAGYDSASVGPVTLNLDEISLTNDIAMSKSGYAYLPGDVNMFGGVWPPVVTGPDVTYLVNYFRSMPTSVACKFGGDLGLFWASADANGDCNVIGSDVTKLVGYFQGPSRILYCGEDETDPGYYPPLWPTPLDLPPSAPPGWPNCE